MKIVVNRCYGGFSLSPEAIKMYLRLNKKKAYFYEDDFVNKSYKKIDNPSNTAFLHVATKDFGEIASSKQLNDNYFSDTTISRDDKKLVKVVEELGEKADGKFAELEVVEVPDDVEWEIDDYDGVETIHEKHRSW